MLLKINHVCYNLTTTLGHIGHFLCVDKDNNALALDQQFLPQHGCDVFNDENHRSRGRADDPTIALEVGYSEALTDLQDDARVLLEGSKGKFKLVILVKIEPPSQPDDCRNAFGATIGLLKEGWIARLYCKMLEQPTTPERILDDLVW